MENRAQILWKISIGLGLTGLLLGLLLRYYFADPLNFNFRYLLHAHSHLMLLGWLFTALLLLIYRMWFQTVPRSHYLLFLGMQVCVLGMLFSFPFQGYGFYSISFSTLHIFFSYVLLWKLWKHSKGRKLPGLLVRTGIVFHYLSTLGPYALGPLMANDMRDSIWYDQAIYFYLHFQYNGSFFMFLLAVILQKWRRPYSNLQHNFAALMCTGVVLTWTHSLDFSLNSAWINWAGGIGSVLQITAGFMLFKVLDYQKIGRLGLVLVTMLALKWIFQLAGSTPAFAEMVAHNRFLLMAFLHFIFLGIYTPFVWLHLLKPSQVPLWMYWSFFVLTELGLVLPSLGFTAFTGYWMWAIFGMYAGLALSWVWLTVRAFQSLSVQRSFLKA